MKYDYNQKELSNNFTPLYIACKFNSLEIVKILLSQKGIILMQTNTEEFNEFEIAFLKGNYDICYYLLYEFKAENKRVKKPKKNIDNIDDEDEINTNIIINKAQEEENRKDKDEEINMNNPYQIFFFRNFNLDKYISLQSTNQFPLFNMKVFYESLCNKIPQEKCPPLTAERKRTKDLLTKIPDPNETWGHFFKRLTNMELYNPPLVDKRNVSHMNSMYMNAQMKLIENEYGIKMNYYTPNEDTRRILDEDLEDDSPILKVENVGKRNIKGRTRDINNENNNIMNANIKSKNENKIEDQKVGTNENICVININNIKSSDRPIKKKSKDEYEEE